MKLSDELIQKINKVLINYEALKEKILSGDIDSIRTLGHISQQGLTPESIIKFYESGQTAQLYKYAQHLIEMKQLYYELCNACYEQTKNNQENKR